MANCLKCGVELNDANKCVCDYCIDHCHCGDEKPQEETEDVKAETDATPEE